MSKLFVLLSMTLFAGGCRDRVDTDERPEYRKPAGVAVEKTETETETADEDFLQTRQMYSTHARGRLDRIDVRIRELEARGDEVAKRAADELRIRRDQVARRLDRVGEQAKAGWDELEAELSRGLDTLERDLDAALD